MLADQAIQNVISAIKSYLGEDPRVDGGTMGMPAFQPKFVFIVQDILLQTMLKVAGDGIVGTPRVYHIMGKRLTFAPTSWWTADSPSLSLNANTLRARALALYLF